MIAPLLLVVMGAAAAPPSYVVERVVTVSGVSTRVSVFRDGVAVRVRTGSDGPSLVLQPLTDVEFRVLIQVVEECYPELVRLGEVGKAPEVGTVELRLAPDGKDPFVITFALTAAQSVGLSRLMKAMDGIEVGLERTGGRREDLRDWNPAVGERVELEDGRVLEVLDVLAGDNGPVVHAQVGDGPVSIFLSADELRRLALRRVPR